MNSLSLSPVFNNEEQLMSSVEIADLTGKQHKNVLKDVRKTLAEIQSAEKVADYKDGRGRQQTMLLLTKREALIVVSGYSIPLRAKVIDRWEELEREKAFGGFVIPRNMSEALRLAVDLSEKVEQQSLMLEEQAPKVEMADELLSTGQNITIGDYAKLTHGTLGMGRTKMFSLLRGVGVLNDDNKPYQYYLTNGWMALRENVYTDFSGVKHINFQPLITPKGQEIGLTKLKESV